MFLFCVTVSSFILFIRHTKRQANPVINLSLFRDKNFVVSQLAIMIFCASLLAIISLQPMLLENVMGYSTVRAGELMGPRGIASALGMMLVPRLMQLIDVRYILSCGLVLVTLGTVLMSQFSVMSPESQVMWCGAIQGAGMGMFFVPLSTIAFKTLPPQYIAEASGLFSFARSIGASIGISLFTSFIGHQSQKYWNLLGGHLSPDNPNFVLWLQQHAHINPAVNEVNLLQQLSQQSAILAFIDTFWLAALSIAVLIPIIWLAKQGK